MPTTPPPTGSAVRAPGRPRPSSMSLDDPRLQRTRWRVPGSDHLEVGTTDLAEPVQRVVVPAAVRRAADAPVPPRRSGGGGRRTPRKAAAPSATADAALALDAADEGDLKQAHG